MKLTPEQLAAWKAAPRKPRRDADGRVIRMPDPTPAAAEQAALLADAERVYNVPTPDWVPDRVAPGASAFDAPAMPVVLDIETTGRMPWSSDLLCVGLGTEVYGPDAGRAAVADLLKTECLVVCHTNYDLRYMCLGGAELGEGVVFHDTKVMAWSLDANQELDLGSLADRYLREQPPKPIRMVANRVMFESEAGLVPIEDVPYEELAAYNRSDIEVTARLYTTLKLAMQTAGLWEHFEREEAPFSRLLVEMEVAGLPFDKAECERALGHAQRKLDTMRGELVRSVGIPDFNPGSGDQLAEYLYGELLAVKSRIAIPRLNGMTPEAKAEAVAAIAPKGFMVDKIGRDYAHGRYVVEGRSLKAPKIEKGKPADSRPTVSAKKLKVLHGDDPWVAAYLDWKSLSTLANTFLAKWIEQEHRGRLHGRFDQSGTATGRLAGREPNLQQVPSRGELDVRTLFYGQLVVGDYSGLEVRLSAHFSGDPIMLDIFRNGRDLYGVLAAEAWGGPPDKTNEHRPLMKVLMLASQYGAQGEKLSETLAFAGMRYSSRQANDLLGNLEKTLPRLFEWREEIIAGAKGRGFVTTLAGRKRYLPDITSVVWKDMAKAERQAVNTVVQGSAADVVRRAMLACRAECTPEEALLILQVHDEMLWERGADWRPDTFERLKHTAETSHGFELIVPLIFDAAEATSWAEKGGEAAINLADALGALA